MLALGPAVAEFEEKIAKYCGSKYAVGISSGSDALIISLMALGIGAGDEVITTPFTFIATVEVILEMDAKPVFVDIEEDTYNLDISKVERAVTKKTRAIIPVHLYGQPADADAFSRRPHRLAHTFANVDSNGLFSD